MNEVRIFDAKGKLKRIISPAKLIAMSDEQLQKKGRGYRYNNLYRKKPKKLKAKVNK